MAFIGPNKFSTKDFTITIDTGGKKIPVIGWDESVSFSIPKPKKRSVKTAIPVANRSFAQYISYRLMKDNLGFVPIQDKWSASTHPGSHITSVIPESVEELLVYFHELGHNKSKQPPKASRGFFGGFSNCNATIECEFNAWVWALKYFRRLGYQMNDSCKELVKTAFKSYIDSAEDEGYASVKASKLSHIVGIDIRVKEKHKFDLTNYVNVNITPTTGTDWSKYFHQKRQQISHGTTKLPLSSNQKKSLNLRNQNIGSLDTI